MTLNPVGHQEHSEVHWCTLKYTEVHWSPLKSTEAHWNPLKSTEVHWSTLKHFGVLLSTLNHYQALSSTLKHSEAMSNWEILKQQQEHSMKCPYFLMLHTSIIVTSEIILYFRKKCHRKWLIHAFIMTNMQPKIFVVIFWRCRHDESRVRRCIFLIVVTNCSPNLTSSIMWMYWTSFFLYGKIWKMDRNYL